MLKMFVTQLTGLFKKLSENEEFTFEDGARLLAQAPVGDGTMYVYGVGEMKAVEFEALEGAEPLKRAQRLNPAVLESLSEADRVVIFSRFACDEQAIEVARTLKMKQIPFVTVATVSDETDELPALADVHIDLGLKKALLPDEMGGRVGYPSGMAALFVYYGLKLTIDEILVEYDL
ncbi:DUF2529 domain-containing protein [Bacillus rubiinfantis]|uniref:DUF2529 domain-containing protein n=1 Tax=Bacillus rubiinfantis TaxID=1499680 RepID=UPI0005A9B6AE|nr:DUF2529 domain-containing protein [Bacillus rubiinfantis]